MSHRLLDSILGSFLLLCCLAAPQRAFAQNGPPPGLNREAMWPAPTAEDWSKPCVIHWQRTFDDAIAVAKATKRPLLVCVNMDGEIASEHWAGVLYRKPELAKIFDGYVPVIGSVYRHTARDYDDQGRRIPCPRFGTVTCGEHIAMETVFYEKFLDGKRISPRHIRVELGETENKTFDIFYTWDTISVVNAVRDGGSKTFVPPSLDRPFLERLTSRDDQDRTAVEEAYRSGDGATRRSLLEANAKLRDDASIDLLRLGLSDVDESLAALARRTLSSANTESAVDAIAQALRAPMPSGERDDLVSALSRIGEHSERARTLSIVQGRNEIASKDIDLAAWTNSLDDARSVAAARESYVANMRLSTQAAILSGNDPGQLLGLAEGFLAEAGDPNTEDKFARLLVQDARDAADRAVASLPQGRDDPRAAAVLAVAAWYAGDLDEARERAKKAIDRVPADAASPIAMIVLGLFAEARQRDISAAQREKRAWPPEWLADVNAAYSVLEKHPFGDDTQIAAHVDFLFRLEAREQGSRVLDSGLARFPESFALHKRVRTRELHDKGPVGLVAYYDSLSREHPEWPSLSWYAGYAALVAAEFHKRSRADDAALTAYDAAVKHFDLAIAQNAECRATADHYAALAFAGRARIEMERGELEAATQDLCASIARRSDAAGVKDGLGRTPAATALSLRQRLDEKKATDLRARLDKALEAIDPALLVPNDTER